MQARIPAMAARRAALAVIALVALVSVGCGGLKVDPLAGVLIPNQAPEVRLTGAPASRDTSRAYFYAYTMQWVGYDPDGRVDHFLFAVDPRKPDVYNPADTNWHATAKNESTFFFSADSSYDPVNPRDPKAEAPHVLSDRKSVV